MKCLSTIFALAAIANLAHADTWTAPQPTSAPVPTYPISSDCAASKNPLQIVTDFAITPDFCVGKNFTLTFTGALSAPIIDSSKLSIRGKLFGRVIYNDQVDLCPLLAEAGTPCPVAASATSFSVQRQLKTNFPPNVPFQFEFLVTNGDTQVIACRGTTLQGKTC